MKFKPYCRSVYQYFFMHWHRLYNTNYFFSTESHIREDLHKLLLATKRSDRSSLQEAAIAVKGRCSRLAHMVKAEIRENPVRYSQESIRYLDGAVRKLESKCMEFL